jgi:hypothetical protein
MVPGRPLQPRLELEQAMALRWNEEKVITGMNVFRYNNRYYLVAI